MTRFALGEKWGPRGVVDARRLLHATLESPRAVVPRNPRREAMPGNGAQQLKLIRKAEDLINEFTPRLSSLLRGFGWLVGLPRRES